MRRLLAAVGVLAVGGATVVWAPWTSGPPGEGGTGRAVAAAATDPAPLVTSGTAQRAATATVPKVVGPSSGWIATLRGPLSWSASPGGPVVGTLPGADPFGAPQVLALVGRPHPDGWARAELPVRPDGTTGWVDTAGVTLTVTGYRVAVSLVSRTLTVTDDGAVVLSSAIGIGATRTPTPPADTYVWELVRPDNPSGAYGPYIFGLAEFSDALATFNGGDAQIGIHGTDEPWTIGESASHGCVHLPDPVVTRLATLLPLGTPVTIS